MPIRVLIADDHPVVRSGYRRLLSLEPDMDVVAECDTGEAAYQWLLDHSADVVVLDLSMPGRGGLDTLQRLRMRSPEIGVLIFSMHDTSTLVQQAFDFGATGYLSKRSAPEEFGHAVRKVAAGQRYLSADIASALACDTADLPHMQLSQREFILFQQLARGRAVKQLADDFNLSLKTVYNHQTSIYRKLGVDNAAQLMQYALQHGLLAHGAETPLAPPSVVPALTTK